MKYDYLIVGAGFSGAVCAERLAAAGKNILLIDRRDHAGGNAYDTYDHNGVLIHPYGPHIFHTNSERIFSYLSRFTEWRAYEHAVLAEVEGDLYPIPINRITINKLYGLSLSEEGVEDFLEKVRLPLERKLTSEDVVLSSVGEDLCEKFFRGYTKKQWGLDLSQLSASVAARIPTRSNDDCRYFTDSFQFMPAEGYHKLFARLLESENIKIMLETDFRGLPADIEYERMIYTGPIDEYFEYRFGRLPYRSLRFEHEHLPDTDRYQDVGTVNYPNTHDFTRITEFKHLTGQACTGTSIVREYPSANGPPFYPVPRSENQDLYRQYAELAKAEDGVHFVGRLAQYKYYNMDQAVAAALTLSERLLSEEPGDIT